VKKPMISGSTAPPRAAPTHRDESEKKALVALTSIRISSSREVDGVITAMRDRLVRNDVPENTSIGGPENSGNLAGQKI